jgi:hypothetical protein
MRQGNREYQAHRIDPRSMRRAKSGLQGEAARSLVRETHSPEDAFALADEMGVHPAIVADRLRHENKILRLLSNLIGKTRQVSQHFAQ